MKLQGRYGCQGRYNRKDYQSRTNALVDPLNLDQGTSSQ